MTMFDRSGDYADSLVRDFNEISLDNLVEAVTAIVRRGQSVNDRRRSNGKKIQEIVYGKVARDLDTTPYYVNILENQINNIVGSYIKQNKVPIFLTEDLDTATVDQYNALYTKLNNKLHYEYTLNKAFEASLAYGESFLQVFPDETHLDGRPALRLITYDRILHDDLWIKDDMSDCSWFILSETITKNAAKIRYPKFKDVIGYTNRDKFNILDFNTAVNVAQRDDNTVEVIYAWFKVTYMRKYLYNKNTGESYYTTFDESLIDDVAKETGLVIKRKLATKWKIGTLVGNIPISYEDNPLFDEIPLIPVIFKRRQEIADDKPKSTGLGQRCYDMVKMFSRHIVGIHDKLDHPLSDYAVINRNAVVNPDDIKDNSKRHKTFYTDNTEIAAKDAVFRYESQGVPPANAQMIEVDINVLTKVTGASEELLGTAPSQRASSITSMMREESALQSYSQLFQNWDNTLRLTGKKIIKFVQYNWDVARVKKEIKQEPTQQFYDKTYLEFDVTLSKGERTDSERNRTLQQLVELASQVQFPQSYYLENMNIEDRAGKVEASKQQEATLQRDEAQARQIEMAKITEEINKLTASAFRDIEAGRERSDRQISNIGLNVERVSEAIKNQSIAMKEMAEAVTKLKEANVSTAEFAKVLSSIEKQIDEKKQEIQQSENRLLSDSEQEQQQDLQALDENSQQQKLEVDQEAQQAVQEESQIDNIL